MTKATFTKQFLEPLAKAISGIDLDHLEYVKATPSNEEYIIIHYSWELAGEKKYYQQKVCVTADSYRAMTIDLLRKL